MADATLPPAYKKSLRRGIAAWLLAVACLAGWLAWKSSATLKEIDARVPHLSAQVKTVYLTPQIVDQKTVTFDSGGDAAVLTGQGAYISIIITGLGLAEDETKRAVDDMPEAVTLALSPYGDLAGWLKRAHDEKHEALVLLPMEPDSFPRNDPGPKALLTRVSEKDNAAQLASILRQSNGAAGVMNFMGSEFLKDKTSLAPVFATLQKAGAVFVEDRRSGTATQAAAVAAEAGLSYIATDIDIDAAATESDVAQKLIDLEKLARQRGNAVGIATPYPVSFNLIKSWAENLEKRGIKLIPITAMAKVQARHEQK